MFCRTARLAGLRRTFSTQSGPGYARRSLPLLVAVGATGVVAAVALSPPLYADILEKGDVPPKRSLKGTTAASPSKGKDELDTFVWGSNKSHAISPSDSYDSKLPTPLSKLSGVGTALRDLAFHEKHAACVDASGNVYQWGDGFYGDASSTDGPVLTLKGKNIVKVCLSNSKVYALSNTGRIYALSARKADQVVNSETPAGEVSWWNPVSWMWPEKSTVDFIEVLPDLKLGRGESFVSISAGQSHLLALTSSGRSFASPISSSANSHGQLGLRKVNLPSPASSNSTIEVQFEPKGALGPYAKSAPATRIVNPTTQTAPATSETQTEESIRYCDKLFEIPSLKGVHIGQLVAGDRTSYARTKSEGRILAWGANEYGQMGLGAAFTLQYVKVPTEVVLSRAYPSGTTTECTNIAAGGDMVYFTVQNTKTIPGDSPSTTVDLLAAGMGQFGSLGNNMYTQSQASPVRVRNVSGLKEYDEATKTTRPLAPKAISASPTNHAAVIMGSADNSGTSKIVTKTGDVLLWGCNTDYQLGLRRRSNMAVPTPLPVEPFVGGYDVDPTWGRLLTRERKVSVVRDLEGKAVGKNKTVEQAVVAGWGCTAVYWKVTA
ncbi:hypothetical protein M407DRAFT_213529 [Tulasnella calospora MUT 4182]|uniref:Uncharacterized protein n=1 Tax=Tulasnella calospora MUT 4182 TaxID=1051891 RepID=A0A0C3QV61_9AGAM|nr:hypothetical protein M407DRAFT_213529 [Tulasnella calospora MUT 4182]